MSNTTYTYTFSPLANVDDSNGGNATGIFLYTGQFVTLTTPRTETWNWGAGTTEHTGPGGDMSCIFGICTDTVDPTQPNFALLYRIGTNQWCGSQNDVIMRVSSTYWLVFFKANWRF